MVLDARLDATPLSLPTERDEVAADWQISSSFKTGDVQMLAINSSDSIGEASAGPSCATTLALDHPELPASHDAQRHLDITSRSTPRCATSQKIRPSYHALRRRSSHT